MSALSLLKLLRNPWVRGGLLFIATTALWLAYGEGRYRHGKRDGIAQERAVAAADLAAAQKSAIASQIAADAATSALRDTVQTLRGRVEVLTEAAALARGNYRAALIAYEREKAARDTSAPLTPEQAACDELARACAVAAETAKAERDTLALTLAAAERRARVQDSVIRTEPQRTALSNREALAAQRAGFKGPSRIVWGVSGTILGAAVAWLVIR